MTIETAIKKAIEGGYKMEKAFSATFKVGEWSIYSNPFLDPLFWRSLGKAMGWDDKIIETNVMSIKIGEGSYKVYWHKFIDHLASGKTIESFFESLPS